MFKMNLSKSEENVSSKDLLYETMRVIYTIGLFIIFLMVKDLKIRAICCITMSIPSILEFIYNRISSKLDF